MTHEEKVIVSAYTGYLLCDDFSDVHNYIERLLGRPVWTHEFADKRLQEKIRELARPDLARICGRNNARVYNERE